ncbi:MAG: hypothetical protein WC943_07775 [Elusimicrobiota bacterium]
MTVIQMLLDESNVFDSKVQAAEKVRSLRRPYGGWTSADEAALAGLRKERDRRRNMAIHEVLRVYDIVPVDERLRALPQRGEIQVPEFKGRKVEWVPVAGDNEERYAVGSGGEIVKLLRAVDPQTGQEPLAIADLDGVTKVMSNVRSAYRPYGAFTRAGDLAVVLHHEFFHFQQFITKGKGDKKTFNELEVEAWRETRAIVGRIGLSTVEVSSFSAEAEFQIREYEKKVENESWKKRFGWMPSSPAALLPRVPGELDEIKKESASIEDAFVEATEKARRAAEEISERQKREQAERTAREEAGRRQAELRAAQEAVDGLAALAGRACFDPRGMWTDEADRFAMLYAAFSKNRHEPGFPDRYAVNAKVKGCGLKMFEMWVERFGGAGRIPADRFQEACREVVWGVSQDIDLSVEWLQDMEGGAAPLRAGSPSRRLGLWTSTITRSPISTSTSSSWSRSQSSRD